jgi:hypothetical protein
MIITNLAKRKIEQLKAEDGMKYIVISLIGENCFSYSSELGFTNSMPKNSLVLDKQLGILASVNDYPKMRYANLDFNEERNELSIKINLVEY